MIDNKLKAELVKALNRDAHTQHKKYFESDVEEIFQTVKYLRRNLDFETSLIALSELKLSSVKLKESKKYFLTSVNLYGGENARVNRSKSNLPDTPKAIESKFKMLEMSLESMIKKIQYSQSINPKTGVQKKDLPIYVHLFRYWIKSIVLKRFNLLSGSIKTSNVNAVASRICREIKIISSDPHGVNVTDINKSYKFICEQFAQFQKEERAQADFFPTHSGVKFFKSLNLNRADWNLLRLHVGDFPDDVESVILSNFIDPFESDKQ